MENLGLSELIIDRESFNSGWGKKDVCQWCEKNKLKMTDAQYLLRGNICNECSSKINEKNMENIEKERRQRLEDKKKMMETLGKQLEHDITEEERVEIVEEMERLYSQIKMQELLAEL